MISNRISKIFPRYANVFADTKREVYHKRWIMPWTKSNETYRYETDESWVWWVWIFGPLGMIVALLFLMWPPKRKITIHEII